MNNNVETFLRSSNRSGGGFRSSSGASFRSSFKGGSYKSSSKQGSYRSPSNRSYNTSKLKPGPLRKDPSYRQKNYRQTSTTTTLGGTGGGPYWGWGFYPYYQYNYLYPIIDNVQVYPIGAYIPDDTLDSENKELKKESKKASKKESKKESKKASKKETENFSIIDLFSNLFK
uniref:Uncharacterized protein n=1 Tax=viral metagenome TaxID=1070528 RepID=A0A6C0H1J3_9ZZZZ